MIMKVKELIESLSKLDPEKNIWILYDYYALLDIVPNKEADEEDVEQFGINGMKLGDYVVSVG